MNRSLRGLERAAVRRFSLRKRAHLIDFKRSAGETHVRPTVLPWTQTCLGGFASIQSVRNVLRRAAGLSRQDCTASATSSPSEVLAAGSDGLPASVPWGVLPLEDAACRCTSPDTCLPTPMALVAPAARSPGPVPPRGGQTWPLDGGALRLEPLVPHRSSNGRRVRGGELTRRRRGVRGVPDTHETFRSNPCAVADPYGGKSPRGLKSPRASPSGASVLGPQTAQYRRSTQ